MIGFSLYMMARCHRCDFPPDPDLIFPASEDYLITITAEVAGVNRCVKALGEASSGGTIA
jgi:hypothetical protein